MLDFIFLSFSISFRVLFEFRFSDSLVLALLRHPAMPEGRTLFKNYSEQKKVQQNIEIAFKFKWKISNKLIGPRKKNIRESPLYLIWVQFTEESFVFFLLGPRKKYKRIPFKFDLSSVYREILCIFFYFSTYFTKNHPSSVILKIVENFSNLMTKLNPQEFWRKLWL